jgi:hypothetical protein
MESRTRTCTHRWVLGEPERGGIQGTCRRCGAQRTYPSGLEPIEEEAVPDFVVEAFSQDVAELASKPAAARGRALV